jgi:hypothetical protein
MRFGSSFRAGPPMPTEILVVFNRGEYWQCAYVIAKESADRLKAQGIGSLRRPYFHAGSVPRRSRCELESFDNVSFSPSQSTGCRFGTNRGFCASGRRRLRRISLAIQDAIAAANILAGPLRGKGPLSDQLLAQVQKRREWPTKVIQAIQVVIQKRIISHVLGGTGKIAPPRFLRLFITFPVLRRLPAA